MADSKGRLLGPVTYKMVDTNRRLNIAPIETTPFYTAKAAVPAAFGMTGDDPSVLHNVGNIYDKAAYRSTMGIRIIGILTLIGIIILMTLSVYYFIKDDNTKALALTGGYIVLPIVAIPVTLAVLYVIIKYSVSPHQTRHLTLREREMLDAHSPLHGMSGSVATLQSYMGEPEAARCTIESSLM